MICPKCNSKNEESNIYCCKCGKKLIKNEFNLKNQIINFIKSTKNNLNKTLDKLLSNNKATALILIIMISVIIINFYVYIHKPKTQSASINNINYTKYTNKSLKPAQAPQVSKEQLSAEKKIIDDYVNKINTPSYTDYKNMDLDLNNKLNNNYFKSKYKKDATLLRAYSLSKMYLENLNYNHDSNFIYPKRDSEYQTFIVYISNTPPNDIIDYSIDSPNLLKTIQICGERVFNISIEYWETLCKDKIELSSSDWFSLYAKRKNPIIGMTKEEVARSTWGKPKDIHTTTSQYGTDEQWVYNLNKYIYFENGVVTTIQN